MDTSADDYSTEDYIAAANAYYATSDAVLPARPAYCSECDRDVPAESGDTEHRYADNGVLLVGCELYHVQDPNTFGITDPLWRDWRIDVNLGVYGREPLPLVGLIEIARRSGVRRGTVTDWRRLHAEFPPPVAELKIGPIFWWPDVKRWLLDTGRRADQDRADIWPEELAQKKLTKLREAFGKPGGSAASTAVAERPAATGVTTDPADRLPVDVGPVAGHSGMA